MFSQGLRQGRYDATQIKAWYDITPGAHSPIRPATGGFLRLVEYSGRYLAKLYVLPARIVQALREYDRVLDPVLILSHPDEYKNLRWAREQLQFCIILSLNNPYCQVREAETQAVYDLFHAELQAESLDDPGGSFWQRSRASVVPRMAGWRSSTACPASRQG